VLIIIANYVRCAKRASFFKFYAGGGGGGGDGDGNGGGGGHRQVEEAAIWQCLSWSLD